ncbi:Penicillin amidase family protein [Ketogulonicigenium robustum]|uniref:Penicillin amidase family protein n=1 Tax=Ketogulonicigenium robustum TaxID=92947 RepID=A0A1W6NZA0_9RHOB|nr:penicillin acylase family protein [Ketogulonicigenium robustum]ARO14575.1 Penicillin amidase family protein [Ketogulonicigenium robustum]
MTFVFRWLLRVATGLIVLGALVVGLMWFFLARSLPDYDATARVSGITAPVEVVRDMADVPHIFAQNDPDAYFALGYAHAQDRLWQMIVARRTVQGTLSELFGARTYESDALLRRLDLYGAAHDSLAAQDPYAMAALEAYADGVNAWLAQVNRGALGRGAPEMWLFNHAIAPWQPADSLAILKLMALQMEAQIPAEVLRAQTSLLLPPDRVADILPDDPGPALATLPRYAEIVRDVPTSFALNDTPRDPLAAVPLPGFQGASNAFAAGPARVASGGTLLANDPHTQLTAPSLWYLARLKLASGDVIGATIPGMPIILSGRSNALGWGITASYLDDLDVYIEEVNPANVAQYRTPDGWKAFETRDSIIQIKNAPAVTLRLQWTDNGPVLPPDQFDLGTIRPQGHVTTIAWSALSRTDASMSAALRVMRAKTVTSAIDAAEGFVAPAINLTLADRVDIGMKSLGAFPIRDPQHDSQGRMPSYGYLPQNRWQGFKPYAENPQFIDPAFGIIGTTNNKIVDAPFPDHMSFVWGDTQRIGRWEHLMQQRQVHTRQSFIETQLDTVSPTARSLLPLVAADLWFTGEAAADGTPERLRQRALALLSAWNGEMNEHLPEPLIYAAWMRALQDRLIRDDLGPLADRFTHVDPVFIERVFRNTDGAGAWCDIIQSAPIEDCDTIARLSLDDALVWITDHYGNAIETLRWGDAHTATSDHPVLGDVPLLGWIVNIRQSSSGGDNTLMRGLTLGTGNDPFLNVHAAAYRGVYDFSDPDNSVYVISTGQSGHPLSPHYDDLGERWRRGEYIPMSLDPQIARASAVGVTHLFPLDLPPSADIARP